MKTFQIRAAFLSLSCACLLGSAIAHADALSSNAEGGAVSVVVEDEAGAPVAKARIFITNGSKTESHQTDASGAVTIDLREGKYTISSAIVQPKADFLARYTSPEAFVQVTAKEITSIVLKLRPVDNAIPDISLATLQKMGVADEVSKYPN